MLIVSACAPFVRDRTYQPQPMPAAIAAWENGAPHEVSTTTSDGLTLRGYYWPPRMTGGDVVLFFPGNSGNYTAARMVRPLATAGDGLLVASYRGYGDNPGAPSEAGLLFDGVAFLGLARELHPSSPIYLFGYPLGGAVALETAAREEVAGVITLGAFTALADVAPPAARGSLSDRFDNRAAIARVEEPILLLHGRPDETVPFVNAQALREASGARARLLRLTGAPHRIDFSALAPIVRENIDQMPAASAAL